eukprot:1606307-Pleurochrysis_carterae.AAC.1
MNRSLSSSAVRTHARWISPSTNSARVTAPCPSTSRMSNIRLTTIAFHPTPKASWKVAHGRRCPNAVGQLCISMVQSRPRSARSSAQTAWAVVLRLKRAEICASSLVSLLRQARIAPITIRRQRKTAMQTD